MEEFKNVLRRDILIQTDDVRVVEMTLEPGDTTPWHNHSNVTETLVCLDGELEIELERPTGGALLLPGDRTPIEAQRAHRIICTGDKSCRFFLVQGVGPYDFVPVEENESSEG
ncbi:MAG: cupin domain-containing protein [Desulfovibrio sp.]|uniref:cupin domain-containing protein n=1 Tax=Desulfovibrio sp. 7SRBS1 TaxID=3378064 RepID=UPI003B409E48